MNAKVRPRILPTATPSGSGPLLSLRLSKVLLSLLALNLLGVRAQ